MYLIIDEGNTAFKLALYEQEELVQMKVFYPHERDEIHSFISDYLSQISNAIVSSVVNEGLDLSRYNFIILILGAHTPLPIQNNYSTPHSLGKDRIANAVGAWGKNPKGNSLVIDLGTCIKYDLVNTNGEYLGGNISPGIEMRFKALNEFTDKLPLLSKSTSPTIYGIDTNSSIHSGVQNGVYNEINGFIQTYSKQFPQLTIFMTGGDANSFDKPFIYDIFAHPNLTLFGLNKILSYNVESS